MPHIPKEPTFKKTPFLQNSTADSEILKFDGPAKQYVRVHGWLEYIKDFTRRRTQAGITTPFKYLTLPGPNMTDIGILWNAGLIEPFEGKVNIAICDKMYANLVVAQMDELGVKLLASDKRLLHEVLKEKKSSFRQHFPFDVINLDLCNALVTGTRKYANLEMLQWIFRFQRGQRFLLLLTTRANEKFSADLVKLLKHNYDREPGFKEAYQALVQQTKLDPLKDSTLFSRLVFPKLIAKYAMTFGYKVIEHFAAYYRRPKGDDSDYYMLSHTFELEPLKPTTVRDTFLPCFPQAAENEHQEKTRVLLAKDERVKASEEYTNFVTTLPNKRFVNVDQLLDKNPALKVTMQNEDEALSGWWTHASAES